MGSWPRFCVWFDQRCHHEIILLPLIAQIGPSVPDTHVCGASHRRLCPADTGNAPMAGSAQRLALEEIPDALERSEAHFLGRANWPLGSRGISGVHATQTMIRLRCHSRMASRFLSVVNPIQSCSACRLFDAPTRGEDARQGHPSWQEPPWVHHLLLEPQTVLVFPGACLPRRSGRQGYLNAYGLNQCCFRFVYVPCHSFLLVHLTSPWITFAPPPLSAVV
ncbi:hypothetical protein QBC41DRAFT_23374 [Cercophora samala]|uniref:Uncharacterized protein n=1 Tax=Cercophora samala TaxID=330535 RepID=A0AA40D885_9PEZI|nr:hypothetical protein QBC41DRAFT_23374 [Cercophora samala]